LYALRVGFGVQHGPKLPQGFQGTPLGDQRLGEPVLLDDVCDIAGGVGSGHVAASGGGSASAVMIAVSAVRSASAVMIEPTVRGDAVSHEA
jgi:hypothetical protein